MKVVSHAIHLIAKGMLLVKSSTAIGRALLMNLLKTMVYKIIVVDCIGGLEEEMKFMLNQY